nr:amino-acid N-acetyltransferase [Mucilaginibacter sp. FT3.2]
MLTAAKLPVSDLPTSLTNFYVAVDAGKVTGVIGLEIYGNYGLLRSLAVSPQYRKQGIANILLNEVECLAKSKKLKAIYLLTETASEYFKRKGYVSLSRGEVADEIKGSSEFSHVCPVSAMVMKKELN